MSAKTRLTIAIAYLCTLAAFNAEAQVPPERAAAARGALMAWLECAECTDGELAELSKYAREVEGALAYTLKQGPSPAKHAEIEEELRAQFRANKWPAHQEADFVKTYLENAKRTYQMRSVTALRALRTPGALRTLREATNPAYGLPDDVRRAAQNALRSP